MRRFWQTSSESDRLAWPILLLLLTVLVPSVGTVWMMREAVRNERLATGQRLSEAYQAQLQSASQVVVDRWNEKLEQLSELLDHATPAQVFAEGVLNSVADSVVVCDEQGRIVYPDAAPTTKFESIQKDSEWERAEQLEFSQQWSAAAEAYGELAKSGTSGVETAQAWQAQARCLLKASDRSTAVEVAIQAARARRIA